MPTVRIRIIGDFDGRRSRVATNESLRRAAKAFSIRISPGSLAVRLYGVEETEEGFYCSYELNRAFDGALERGGLRIISRGDRDEPQVVELLQHQFFIATLFQPPLSSAPGRPHPLILGYLRGALAFLSVGGDPGS